MKRRAATIVLLFALLLAGAGAAPDDATWQKIEWNHEAALVSSAQGWKAIVSLARGRLVFFGDSAEQAPNLILAANDPHAGVGAGHRVWFGPQSTWGSWWPPPAAWEQSAPEKVATENGVLRLTMPESGDGWPRLTRTYRWDGARLVCGVEAAPGGTRATQVIEIIQIPVTSLVSATAQPDATVPAGFVLLPGGARRKLTTEIPDPLPQLQRRANRLALKNTGEIAKLGLRPQVLTADEHGWTLFVRRGDLRGRAVSEPDLGCSTQVYLGGPEAFIELEQLSPLFAAGEAASFSIVLEGARAQ